MNQSMQIELFRWFRSGSKTPRGAGTRLTRQTTPEPRDARVATHHTTHPIKRGRGGDGDGDGARTWEQRGREPDGIGDGTLLVRVARVPRCTGRRGGKRLRHPRAASGVSGKSVTNIASTKVGPQVPGSHRAEKPPPPFYRYDVTVRVFQRPGTDGRGPPPQSEHRRQSISSDLASFPPVRGLIFGSTACGGPGRSASSLLRLRRASSAQLQWRSLGTRLAPAPCSTRGPL